MLLQLLRLLKLTRYSPAFALIADVLKGEAESLLVSVMLMFIIFIFASVGIYTFEHQVQPLAFGSIPHAMWWAIVTLTTVGYGDVTPQTRAASPAS
jgi:voltage-gated potassium channel